jgi:hypothetical protein
MSKHETWRTRIYWNEVGGLLIEEFLAVQGTSNQGRRPIDGVIVLNEKTAIHIENIFDIKGKDVIVIQTKSRRLGMYLLGQAYFSRFLIEKFEPRSIKTVAICSKNDAVMSELAKAHDVEIVIIPDEQKEMHDMMGRKH